MSEYVPIGVARQVRQRAEGRCEYCHLPQESQEAAFHIDHIQPLASGGKTVADNLALACVTCSLSKAARTAGRDPVTGDSVPLFHPRRDRWSQHFQWAENWKLVGLSAKGRATIRALKINRPEAVRIRRLLERLGEAIGEIEES